MPLRAGLRLRGRIVRFADFSLKDQALGGNYRNCRADNGIFIC